MGNLLKQATIYNRSFLLVQSSDHITGLSGATPVVSISKAGSTPLHTAGAAITEIGRGWYYAALTTSDTNTLGDLTFSVVAASGDPCDWADQVRANILGDTLPSNVTQWNSSNVASPATAGVPDVNIKNFNNLTAGAVTAINAIQGTGQAINFSGASTSGTVLVDTRSWLGVAAQADGHGYPKVDIEAWRGNALVASLVTGVPVVDIGYFLGTASVGTAGYAAPDWGHVNAPTTALDLSGTTIKNLDGNTVQTGDSFARLGAPANASIAADIAEVEAETDLLLAGVTVTTNNDKTGYTLSNAGVDALYTRQLVEAYAAIHVAPTLAQLMFELRAHHSEKSISNTSVTLNMIDGATFAEGFNLNNTSPTSITRSA